MSKLVLKILQIVSIMFLLLPLSSYAAQQESFLKSQLVESKAKLKKIENNLAEIQKHLDLAKQEQIKANEKIEKDGSELAIRRAKLITIRLERYVSKNKRLEKNRSELKKKIVGINWQLQKIAKEKARAAIPKVTAIPSVPKVTAIPSVPKATVPKTTTPKVIATTKPVTTKPIATKKVVPVKTAPPVKAIAEKTAVKVVSKKDQGVSKKSPVIAEKKTQLKTKKSIASSSEPAGWPSLKSAKEKNIVFAKVLLENLKKNKAQGRMAQEPLDEVKITNKHSFGTLDMEYVGDNYYSLVTKLKPGRQVFEIFNHIFIETIPQAKRKEKYRIIYDITSVSKPKLFVFQERLIK